MKKFLRWFVLPMVLLVGVLVAVANLMGRPGELLPSPDPDRLITLPDGRQETLGALLTRASRSAEELPVVPEAIEAPDTTGEPTPLDPVDEVAEALTLFRWPAELSPDETDVFLLGRHAMRAGRLEEALALLQSVPEDHDDYDTAQRFIGWELLTKEMDKPGLGLAYMNRALDAGPLKGENWQDASRVYLRTIGIRWDPVNNTMR